jgi:prepilin-type N-terminal cleavage/methylation domain-containing protein
VKLMTVQTIKNKLHQGQHGFTLIELLIVIAILGVLAVVVLLAINPVQQLARARDAGRISGVAQLGHALEAFATNNNGNYVNETGAGCTVASWIGCLTGAGEISAIPGAIAYTAPGAPAACTENAVNGLCYDATTATGGPPAVVYASLESLSHNSRCSGGTPVAFAAYSSAQGRGGIVCGAAAGLNPGVLTFLP